jgi:hypothetical protein
LDEKLKYSWLTTCTTILIASVIAKRMPWLLLVLVAVTTIGASSAVAGS